MVWRWSGAKPSSKPTIFCTDRCPQQICFQLVLKMGIIWSFRLRITRKAFCTDLGLPRGVTCPKRALVKLQFISYNLNSFQKQFHAIGPHTLAENVVLEYWSLIGSHEWSFSGYRFVSRHEVLWSALSMIWTPSTIWLQDNEVRRVQKQTIFLHIDY